MCLLAIPKAQKWIFVSYTENFFVLPRLVFTLKVRERDLTPCSKKIWKPHSNLILPDSRVNSHGGNGDGPPVFHNFTHLGSKSKYITVMVFNKNQFYPLEGGVHLAISVDIFICHNWGDATGI